MFLTNTLLRLNYCHFPQALLCVFAVPLSLPISLFVSFPDSLNLSLFELSLLSLGILSTSLFITWIIHVFAHLSLWEDFSGFDSSYMSSIAPCAQLPHNSVSHVLLTQ